MAAFDQTFPPVLTELHTLEFDYADGDGIDFEPYDKFQSADDNASWIKAWTGNKELTGGEYRVFGQDGTGGYAAFWLARPGKDLLEQPVIFFGSEGELGVVANDFGAYLWLLAGGFGPLEALQYSESERPANPAFTKFATTHAEASKKTPMEIVAAAKAAFPTFETDIRALCK